MHFSDFPVEIVHEILTAAVKVRGIQRATRLRYVSRSWAAAVLEAIFASGILDNDPRSMSSHSLYYKPRYLACRVLSRVRALTRPLRIVRKVAEYIVARRNPDSCYEDAIRDCIYELCRIPHIGINHNCSRQEEDWLTGTSAESIDEHDMQFQQALLSAAAWMSELTLIRDTLPLFQNCLYLISHDGWGGKHKFEFIFGSPLILASLRGNSQVVKLLIKALSTNSRGNEHIGDILEYSAKGNHLSTVELVLEPKYDHWNSSLVKGLEGTTSVKAFKRLLPLAKDHLQIEFQSKPAYYEEKFLPRQLVKAARDGNMAMTEHLLQLGIKTSALWFKPVNSESRNPAIAAANHGHKDILSCLIKKGFTLNQRSLEAAIRYGNPEVVHMILKNMDQQHSLIQPLLIAVEKENEVVVKMLMSLELTHLVREARVQAIRKADELGLESMAKLLG